MSFVAAIWEPDDAALAAWTARPTGILELRRPVADQGRYAGGDSIGALVTWRADRADRADRVELSGLGRRVWAWRVESHRVRQGTAPLRMIALVRRRADLTHEEFVEHWTHQHAPLALRHHVGLAAYTQHVVREPLTGGAEVVDAIAELGFATRVDLETRFYDSDAGRDTIAADVRRFTAGPGPDTTLMEPVRGHDS